MSADQSFDPTAGHRFFSADYFNRVWDLLDKDRRSEAEGEKMLSMCHASLAHWRDRDDCGARQLSVGYWQLSRVYAALGNGISARTYAEHCLSESQGEPPFYLGYAYEALCRAAKLNGDAEAAAEHLGEAREQMALVESGEDRRMLEADLDQLASDE